MTGHYYLHSNGDLIYKREAPDDDSDFVVHVWAVDTSDRATGWVFLIEALDRGASIERVKELARRWGFDRGDLPHFLIHHPEPTPNQKRGLRKFIEQVLGEDTERFFDELLKSGPPQPTTP